MPYAELVEWMQYAQVEGFGSHYDDLRAGLIGAAIYNVARDPAKRPQPFLPLDFTPWNALSPHHSAPAVAARPVGDGLTPDQLSALIDARMFGKT